MFFTTEQEEEELGKNTSLLPRLYSVKFLQHFWSSAFLMFSFVSCVCEQRVDVSEGEVVREIRL